MEISSFSTAKNWIIHVRFDTERWALQRYAKHVFIMYQNNVPSFIFLLYNSRYNYRGTSVSWNFVVISAAYNMRLKRKRIPFRLHRDIIRIWNSAFRIWLNSYPAGNNYRARVDVLGNIILTRTFGKFSTPKTEIYLYNYGWL